jgi:adenylate cyclase
MLASDETIRETGGRIFARKIDRVRVMGIKEPVLIHELLNTVDLAGENEKKLVEVFHQAMDCYEKREWEKAVEGFQESFLIEGGGPSLVYIERCKNYILYPPSESWDGIFNLSEK